MRKAHMCAGLGALALLVLTSSAAPRQQETPVPKKFTNVSWYEVVNVKFHPQHEEEALSIIFNNFLPAGQAIPTGTPPRILEYATGGQWDVTVMFPLKDGPGQLEWEQTQGEIDWMTQLARRAGGIDKAEELFKRYLSFIDEQETQLVRERNVASTTSRNTRGR